MMVVYFRNKVLAYGIRNNKYVNKNCKKASKIKNTRQFIISGVRFSNKLNMCDRHHIVYSNRPAMYADVLPGL